QISLRKVLEYQSEDEVIQAVITGKADALIRNIAFSYRLKKHNLTSILPTYFIKGSELELHFAMNKDYPEAISILDKALLSIGKSKILELKYYWTFTPPLDKSITPSLLFSPAEKAYLAKKKALTLCIDPHWKPIESLDDGKLTGVTADFMALFEKRIGIPINVINTKNWIETLDNLSSGECNFISLMTKTKKRQEKYDFSAPYLATQLAMVSLRSIPFISDTDLLTGKKVGMIEGYGFEKLFKRNHPDIEVIPFKSHDAGFQSVINKEIIGLIDVTPVLTSYIQKYYKNTLSISAQFKEQTTFSASVLKGQPELLSILNKTIQSTSSAEREAIINKHFTVIYQPTVDYGLLKKLAALFVLITLIVGYRHFTLLRYNKHTKSILTFIDTNIMMVQIDGEGRFTDTSHSFCEKLAYKKEELVGQTISRIYYNPNSDLALLNIKSELENCDTWEEDLPIISKFGDRLWFNVKITKNNIKHFKNAQYTLIFQDIENQKLLEKVSQTDSLTKIPNRLFLDNLFENELMRSLRYQTIFSIIIVDIDYFKSFNDKYGHQIGDEVLIRIAHTLIEETRNVDSVGRWGGEEFLIICPETSLMGAKKLAEKIRVIIQSVPFKQNETLTCSFGVAQYEMGIDDQNSLFEKADKALYNAKETGRNKVVAL
ncbi:MAG TPA: diguanylate cyclase, partial [Psychromonas hadalis]|nr:diguanylate cyclase [Psychromonas hadalis]